MKMKKTLLCFLMIGTYLDLVYNGIDFEKISLLPDNIAR